MSPVLLIVLGMLIVYVAASGRWEATYKALTGEQKAKKGK